MRTNDMTTTRWFAVLVLGVLWIPSIGHTQCTELSRKVALDKKTQVPLKSYECRTGPELEGRVRVEFHRFNDMAASLIVGKSSSDVLRKILGEPTLIENEVFKKYAELRKQYGSTREVPVGEEASVVSMALKTAGTDESTFTQDRIDGSKMRTVFGGWDSGWEEFPAAEEIQALKQKTIPPILSYFFSLEGYCDTSGPGRNPACAAYGDGKVEMVFWRSLRSSDIDEYGAHIAEYNRLLRDTSSRMAKLPKYLALVKRMAGTKWPDDFILLEGRHAVDCGEDVGRWTFGYTARTIELEAMLLENASAKPITVEGVLGSRSDEGSFRPVSAGGASGGDATTTKLSVTLAPGKRLLLPLAIRFPAPTDDAWKESDSKASAIKGAVDTMGFTGNVDALRTPHLKDFVYGPEIRPTGLQIGGRKIEFVRRTSNLLDLTASAEIGSCPYLLSWSDVDREWMEHGKVLDEGLGAEREYTETVTFAGFRSHFRLEEREAEIASIDQAVLVLMLSDGRTVTLAPEIPSLAAHDGNRLELLWRDALDLSFALPDSIATGDVTQSQFVITGYYERYSSLFGAQ